MMEIRQTEAYSQWFNSLRDTGKHERASMHVYVACRWATLET